MRVQVKVLIILLTLVVLAAGWLPVRAQTENPERLSTLIIRIWPEYDDPRVLVLYDGEIAGAENITRTISLFLPGDAELNAVAYEDAKGQLLNAEAPQVEKGTDGFARVTFKSPLPRFHVEFYYNPLQGAPNKTMDFVYKSAQSAEQVRLEIQEPLKAEKFTTAPVAALQSKSAQHEFKYHIFEYTAVKPEQLLRVRISYTKTDPNPSLANVTAPAPAQAAEPTATSSPFLIAGLAAVLALGVLGVLAWWSRRGPGLALARGGGGARRKGSRRGSGAFCYQCGRVLNADDNFCPRCGAKKRG